MEWGLVFLRFFTTINQIWTNEFVNAEYSHSPYSAKEIHAVRQFRPLVEEYLTLDFQRTDAYLLRWLRVNKFVIIKAAEELKNNYQWRKKNRIDSIFDKNEIIPKDLPYTIDGVDRRGYPIVIFWFGDWPIRKYALAGKQSDCVRQFHRMIETGIRKAFEMSDGTDVDQIYIIPNIRGFSQRTHACVACIPILTDFMRAFAVGSWQFAKNVTLINSPRIFEPIMTLARSIITKIPLYNFDVNKSVWREELLKEIAEDQLPPSLGGSRRTISPSKEASLKPKN